MKLIIDCADIDQIKEIYGLYPISGVTSNPTILKRANRPPYEALKEIREFIGLEAQLHVQVVSKDIEGMLEEARCIKQRLGENTYIKIPVDNNGLIVIRKLHEAKFNVTATAVYTAMQAYLAALAGADYVAPYVNRIEVLDGNGVETACLIHDIFQKNGLPCKVLGASFKRADQILRLAVHGIDAATISYDLMKTLLVNEPTAKAIDAFIHDFETLCGKGATMMEKTKD